MSKSLKNFITIEVGLVLMMSANYQEALETYTPRQLRLSFMLQTWNAKMDFRRDLITDVKTKEETFDVSHLFSGTLYLADYRTSSQTLKLD
jgi:cysteinyl-tRNA synthetase